MKKIIFNIIFVGLISVMLLPIYVNAGVTGGSILTLEASETNRKITVSGTTGAGVLAIATLVYSSDDLVYMGTCEASEGSYSCVLDNTFSAGDYLVKVANYEGGNYVTDNISISNNDSENNPQTSDSIMNSIIIGGISLIGLLGVVLYIKRKKLS